MRSARRRRSSGGPSTPRRPASPRRGSPITSTPWNDAQGESPFVWSVLGAVASATESMRWTTAVTCPTVRTDTHYTVENARLYSLTDEAPPILISGFGPKSIALAGGTAHRLWPNEALSGELAQVLPSPRHFEQATELVTEEHIASSLPDRPRRGHRSLGPDAWLGLAAAQAV